MGNSPSTLTTCLLTAVGRDASLVATPSKPLFQITDVHPYNLDYQIQPIAVTYPKTSAQVSDIVKCANTADVKVQARSGGHSYANFALGGVDGSLVIDLKNLRSFSYSPSTQRASIGAGTLLGDITKQLDKHGRAMAHGTCPQVGIGGHATIGGLGPASRMWGAALDHVVGAEVVLADGSVVRAADDENEDLLFAIKGAAAGFGVVTNFEVRTQEVPKQAIGYSYAYDFGDAGVLADAFTAWQALITGDEVREERRFASQFILTPIGAIISGTFFGSEEELEKLDTKSVFPHAINDTKLVFDDWLGVVGHWAEDTALELIGGVPSAFYSQSMPFSRGIKISKSGAKDLFDFVDKTNKDTPVWFVIFDLEGGATNDVLANATAYAHRDAEFWMQSYAVGLLGLNEETKDFVRGVSDTIKKGLPDVDFGAYPGYVDAEMEDGQAQEKYWGGNLERLMEIKAKVDSKDRFWNPQSVRPKK